MARILVRPALFVVTALALSLLAGCSGLSANPVDQANESVSEANRAIEEHNRLLREARGTYEEARGEIEAGENTSQEEDTSQEETTSQEVERITQARETMQQARDTLEGARDPLARVQNLDVDSRVVEYARLLSDAVESQLAAEAREVEFYQIMEGDPKLSEDRQQAEDLLSEIDDGYKRAGDSYDQAQQLADANPELLGESSTGP